MKPGVCGGGSLLFHATLCEAIGKGRVIGVDVQIPAERRRKALNPKRVCHRITMIEGDSISSGYGGDRFGNCREQARR